MRSQTIIRKLPGLVFQLRRRAAGGYWLPYVGGAGVEWFNIGELARRDPCRHLAAAVHPADHQRMQAHLAESARDLTDWAQVLRAKAGDGTERWLLVNARPETCDDGGVLWHGCANAIGHWPSLGVSLGLARLLLDGIVDAALLIDEAGALLSLNPMAQKIFGYADDEVVGCGLGVLLPGWAPSEVLAKVRQRGGAGLELAGRRKDGGLFPALLAVAELNMDGGTALLGFVREVWTPKANEARLPVASDGDGPAKAAFLYGLAHELRTPLNVILGFGQLLLLDARLGGEVRANIEEIHSAGQYLLEMVNHTLDWAQMEAGQLQMAITAVDCAGLAHTCVAWMRPLAARRGITISQGGLEGLAVMADPLRLKQVLLNLLSNAVKYNRDHGQVTLSAEAAAGWVRIKVIDTGPGLPEGRVEELFRPFQRLGGGQDGVEGHGLGLVLSKRMVELMGGSIGVENHPGLGCVFWVRLPAAHPQALPVPPAVGPARQRQILVLEDHPGHRRLLKKIFQCWPVVRVHEAATAAEGLVIARTLRPDLILLDIYLPDMDGFEVLRALQDNPATAATPVVVVSASATPGEISRGLQAGALAYLTKPIRVAQLLAVVGQQLGMAAG